MFMLSPSNTYHGVFGPPLGVTSGTVASHSIPSGEVLTASPLLPSRAPRMKVRGCLSAPTLRLQSYLESVTQEHQEDYHYPTQPLFARGVHYCPIKEDFQHVVKRRDSVPPIGIEPTSHP